MPEEDPFDPENEAHAGYEKLWKTISKLPHLESLYLWKPMDFKLNLRDFPALKTLTFHYGQLRENIGGLPSLEHLSLLYFHRIDSSWLHPRLVRTLKSLRLKKPGAGDLRAIASSFKHFSSVLKTPSSLQSLSFELHPFAESSTYYRILEDFMKSLSPVSFPNLRYLAAHSIYDDIFGTSSVGFRDGFLRQLPFRFPHLRELSIVRGDKDANELRMYHAYRGNCWPDHLAILAQLPHLQFLTINYLDYLHMDSIRINDETFEVLPKLLYFEIRPKCPFPVYSDHPAAWMVIRDDQQGGKITKRLRLVHVKESLDDWFTTSPLDKVEDFSMGWYRAMVHEIRKSEEEEERSRMFDEEEVM
ncbi:hypothetical protein JCM3765_004402 [Sporobolomyces pararoseus]